MRPLHAPASSVLDLARSQLGLLALAEGFFPFRVLVALLRLRVFEQMGGEAWSAGALARAVDVHEGRLARLLDAGVAFGLLTTGGGADDESGAEVAYRVEPAWAPLLSPEGGDSYLGDWLEFLTTIDDGLRGLDRAVRHGGPVVDAWNPAAADVARSTRAMHSYAAVRGRELAHFLDTTGCRSLLDVGCGPGTYAFQLGAANPDLALFLLDFPEVLETARDYEAAFALANPVHYLPLDVAADAVPGTYDLVLLSNTLHAFDEPGGIALLRRLYDNVRPGGSLVVQTPFLDDDRRGGRWPVAVDLNLLCLTSGGRNHTAGEVQRWLTDVGFEGVQHCPMSLLNVNSFLRGYRP